MSVWLQEEIERLEASLREEGDLVRRSLLGAMAALDEQDVELAHRSETRGDASKATVELMGRAVVELEDGQQFAKPA